MIQHKELKQQEESNGLFQAAAQQRFLQFTRQQRRGRPRRIRDTENDQTQTTQMETEQNLIEQLTPNIANNQNMSLPEEVLQWFSGGQENN
ncbi:hypothetical protein QTN25_007757 [Entamoeba marina]